MHTTKIHHSLLRHQTFLGVDRELCMILSVISITIGITQLSVKSIITAIVIFLCGFYLLRKMAQKDLLLRKIYLRYQKYDRIYEPQAHSFKSNYRGM